jgi:CubicO group peptidase (beta-lactamase class C family)
VTPQRRFGHAAVRGAIIAIWLTVPAIVLTAPGIGPAAQARRLPQLLARDLEIADSRSGMSRCLDLVEAMRAVHVPTLTVAVIDGGRLAWNGTWGRATPESVFQAASLLKLVTGVGALRLVEEHRLSSTPTSTAN